MSKTAKKRPSASSAPRAPAAKPSTPSGPDAQKSDPGSKQSRIIAMLRSPSGTTIVAMTKATGWQQHSVRGFFAGVVRKKLGLTLKSEKTNGERIYHVVTSRRSKLKAKAQAARN